MFEVGIVDYQLCLFMTFDSAFVRAVSRDGARRARARFERVS